MLPQPQSQWVEPRSVDNQAIADTVAQMDIYSTDLLHQLRIDPASLVPVRARIFGVTSEAKIDIIGGIILEISDPLNHAVTRGHPQQHASYMWRTMSSAPTSHWPPSKPSGPWSPTSPGLASPSAQSLLSAKASHNWQLRSQPAVQCRGQQTLHLPSPRPSPADESHREDPSHHGERAT